MTISKFGPVRAITNDAPNNKVGDFALIRLDLGEGAAFVPFGNWRLIGCSIARYGKGHSYVDRVYVFDGGTP